jgi:hypothetical protein
MVKGSIAEGLALVMLIVVVWMMQDGLRNLG